jgi:hypothetical protein
MKITSPPSSRHGRNVYRDVNIRRRPDPPYPARLLASCATAVFSRAPFCCLCIVLLFDSRVPLSDGLPRCDASV